MNAPHAMNALPALPEGLSTRATTLLEKHETPALVYEGDSWFVTNAMHRFSTTALVIPNIDKHGLFIDRHGEVKITPPPEDPAPKGVRYEFRRKIARGEVVLNSILRLWYRTTIDSPDSPNWTPRWVATAKEGYRIESPDELATPIYTLNVVKNPQTLQEAYVKGLTLRKHLLGSYSRYTLQQEVCFALVDAETGEIVDYEPLGRTLKEAALEVAP